MTQHTSKLSSIDGILTIVSIVLSLVGLLNDRSYAAIALLAITAFIFFVQMRVRNRHVKRFFQICNLIAFVIILFYILINPDDNFRIFVTPNAGSPGTRYQITNNRNATVECKFSVGGTSVDRQFTIIVPTQVPLGTTIQIDCSHEEENASGRFYVSE